MHPDSTVASMQSPLRGYYRVTHQDTMPFLKYVLLLGSCSFLAACDSGGPDGPETVRKQMVLFASDRGGGGNMNIWMMTPEGEDLRQITYYTEGDFWPADISPDGKRLLFYRLDDFTLISGIYIMDLDGPEPNPDSSLVQGLSAAGSFFPDGERFVYEQYLPALRHEGIFVYDLRDSSSVQVSSSEIHSYHPRVSPAGSEICHGGFADTARSAWQVFLMNADGSNRRAITPGEPGNYASHCAFSPEGDRIFYSMTGDLHWIDIAAGEIHRIEKKEYDDYPFPDTSGTRLFFREGGGAHPDAESEIYVINLDRSGLTRLTTDGFRDDKPVVGVVEFEE